jgi:hypothetical protein
MAGGVYDSQNFEQIQLKVARSKEVFFQKIIAVLGDFFTKSKSFHVFFIEI